MGIKKTAHPIPNIIINGLGNVTRGLVVEHPIFGVGEVVDIAKWEAGDITIKIRFERQGEKWLAPEYANFSLIKTHRIKSGIFTRIFQIFKNVFSKLTGQKIT